MKRQIKDWLKSNLPGLADLAKSWKYKLNATQWPEKSIVFYTGRTAEKWTPDSLKRGLAGAQTGVVYLAREWAKQGYKVTVYNYCRDGEGLYDGVEYRNYDRFNPWDTFDRLIIWRNKTVQMLDLPLKANKIFLELQDVPYNIENFTKERLDRVDKIFVKCQFHRTLLPQVPDEKFAIIPNGVDRSLLELSQHPKHLNKLIYASNYERGLESMLLYGWPILKKESPEAKLEIYYGWQFFDESYKRNPEKQAWKQKMIELMNQPDVTDHGRIGQDKLVEEKSTAAIHYYGCTYQEVDCISVRESAMVGCVPVTTDFAALAEKSYCLKIAGDPFAPETQEAIARQIVELLKNPDRLEQIRQDFQEKVKGETWDNIAQKWLEEMTQNTPNQ